MVAYSLILAVALSLGTRVYALGGDLPSEHRMTMGGVPPAVYELIYQKNRVNGYFWNPQEWHFYAGDTAAFEAFLKQYAALGGIAGHRLSVHKGKGQTESPGAKEKGKPCDWMLSLAEVAWIEAHREVYRDPRSAAAKTDKPEFLVELHVWTGGNVNLEKVRIPDAVNVVREAQANGAAAQAELPKTGVLDLGVGLGAKAKQYPPLTVTPYGADASIVFEELGRKGLHALGLNALQHQWGTALSHLLIPVELRFKPVDGRQLIEAVASARGLKVAWVRDDKYAVLHTGAADTEVERVRNDLESNDVRARNDAAWRGGWLRDVRAVPLLIKATKDGDAEVARQALVGLRKMNWEAVLAVDEGAAEVVARELDSRDNMIRREASFALGLLGWEKALPLLEKALADDDDIVRHHAVRALGQIGDEKALALLERTLADKQSRSSSTVVEALGSIGGEKALALLEKTLADKERIVRYHAAEALGRVGGEKALARLENALPDTDPFFRSGVVVALGRVGGEKALALLDKTLTDPSLEMRRSAVVALGSAGCAGGVIGEKAQALLEKALTDHDAWVRRSAVWALANMGGEKALALLEKALADADATVRRSAADALGDIGGEKALALLEKALADPDGRVGGRAAYALGRIDGEKALALLEKALAYPDTLGEKHIVSTRRQMDDVHQGAVSALADLSWEKSLTLLEKGLASPNVNLRWGAVAALGDVSGMDGGVASALGNIGGDKALRLLEKALDDPDVQVREKAIYGLGLVGGEKALALLEKMLAEPFVGARVELPHAGRVQVIIPRASVNFALGQVGGERARELLEKALADKDAWVRYNTAGALAKIGGERACKTVLAALTAEKTKWGRSHIREVLERYFGDVPAVQEALKNLPPLPAEEAKPEPPPQRTGPDAGF